MKNQNAESKNKFFPLAKKQPRVFRIHNDFRVDMWHWLKDHENPDVITYLQQENVYSESLIKKQPIYETIYHEIEKNGNLSILSTPIRRGEWLYFSKFEEGMPYKTHYRQHVNGSKKEVILDENRLGKGHQYLSCAGLSLSSDHQKLAYLVDTSGNESYLLKIRDIKTGLEISDHHSNISNSGLAWSKDAANLFYVRHDENLRPFQVWKHRMGTSSTQDSCVYTEEDINCFLDITETKDRSFILINVVSHDSSEVLFLSTTHPEDHFVLIEPRRESVFYLVDHHKGWFLILTDGMGDDPKLCEVPVENPGRKNWHILIPNQSNIQIEGIELFDEFLVIQERRNALTEIHVISIGSHDLDTGKRKALPPLSQLHSFKIPKGEDVSVVEIYENPEFQTNLLRYEYYSLVTPRSIYECNMETGKTLMLDQEQPSADYNPDHFESKRIWVSSKDGTQVPVSLVYKQGALKNKPCPTVLYGYGAYGYSVPICFTPFRLSLLERGFVFAIAHVRGGGELGEEWHRSGRLSLKENTINDFINCARYLINEGLTSPDKLIARGRSAGGQLVAASVNREPHLFAGIVAEVPFVDCLNTLLDDSLPFTPFEWEEWGNPKADIDSYYHIKAYSPCDNVSEKVYPPILATASFNDPRVGYWEPAKWILRLREKSISNSPFLLNVDLTSGHMENTNRYKDWHDEAFVLTFILQTLEGSMNNKR